jgi:tetratricopeptide (TPR) repeat protein
VTETKSGSITGVTGVAQDLLREAQRLHGLNRVPEAIQAYQRLLLQWPDDATSWFNLGVLLRRIRSFDEALVCYQRAIQLGITNPEEVHLNSAVIYADYLRQDAAAEQELRTALAINPGYVPALLNLANIMEDLGRRAEAMHLYLRILELDSRCFMALARYANMQRPAECGPQLVAQLRAALAHPAADPTARIDMGFALGRVLDACGAYDAAFSVYAAANSSSRVRAAGQGIAYNRQEHERFIDRLIAVTSPARRPNAVSTAATPRPIFICGMFRSGSTLVEQLLAQHPGVAAGGELDLLPSWVAGELAPFPETLAAISTAQLERLSDQYLNAIRSLFPGATHVIDKRPDNFLHIGLIKSLFPEAKIVHTTRAPLDNCLSIYFLHLDERMSYATELLDIGHYFREYRRLMAHWKRLFGFDIVDLDYDLLVREPERTAPAMFEALGLGWDPQYLERTRPGHSVKTASVWQVRAPLYTYSSGRAEHYARQLAELNRYLAGPAPA